MPDGFLQSVVKRGEDPASLALVADLRAIKESS